VFVFGNQTIDDVKTIEILQEDKQPILQEPSNIFSIDEKSLFQDIHGFSMVNDVNHPIYEKTAEEYIEKGNNNYHKSEFEKAIEAYKKAIEINPVKKLCRLCFDCHERQTIRRLKNLD
jgi:tetratricopeptide (TPR) repeat protein